MSHQPAFFDSVREVARCKSLVGLQAVIGKARQSEGGGEGEGEGTQPGDDVGVQWYIEYAIRQLFLCCSSSPPIPAPSSSAAYSLSQMHYVYIAVELLWEWRVRRYYESIKENHALCLAPVDAIATCVKTCCDALPAPTVEQVWEAIECISATIHAPAFERAAMQRNMGRVLVTLILLSSQTSSSSSSSSPASVSAQATSLLSSILRGPNKNAVVSGLQASARCTRPTRARTAHLLQELLLLPGGLEAVMRGYAHESMEIGMIVRVLTSVPQGSTREGYFSTLAPHLVRLIRDAATVRDVALLGICAGIVGRMLETSPGVAESNVLAVLGAPLLQINAAPKDGGMIFLSSSRRVLASHAAVKECVLSLAALISAAPSSGLISGAFDRAGLAQPIVYLAMHCHTSVAAIFPAASGSPSKVIEPEVCALLDAAAFLCGTFFRACPTRAAELLEICVVLPTPNSFRAGAAMAVAEQMVRSTHASNAEVAVKCNVEICAGQEEQGGEGSVSIGGKGESGGGGGGGGEAEEAYASILRSGERASALLLLLVARFDPPGSPDANFGVDAPESVAAMVSSLCARTLASFLRVPLPLAALGGGEREGQGELREGEGEPTGLSDAGLLGTGGSMVFLILQQHLPAELLLCDRAALVPPLAAFLNKLAREVNEGHSPLPRHSKRRSAREELKEEDDDDDEDEDEDDSSIAIAETALSIVHQMTLLEMEKTARLASTDARCQPSPLSGLLLPLQRVASMRSNAVGVTTEMSRVAQAAAETGLAVLASSLDAPESLLPASADTTTTTTAASAASVPSAAASIPPEVAELLKSEHPAMQALGCKALVQTYIERARRWGQQHLGTEAQGDLPPSPEELQRTLNLLLSLLRQGESFVYLSALHGFVSLAGVGGLVSAAVENCEEVEVKAPRLRGERNAVLGFLLEAFAGQGEQDAKRPLSIRERALVGEALFLIVRKYGNVLGAEMLARVAAGCLLVSRAKPAVPALASTSEGDESQAARVAGEDAIFLCSSAVSILAELVAGAGPGVGYLPLQDLLGVVLYLLAWQKAVGGAATAATAVAAVEDAAWVSARAEMRRASGFLLHRVILGLGPRVLTADGGAVIRDVYQALKRSMRDGDKVVVFHAENALALLDEIVTSQLSLGKA